MKKTFGLALLLSVSVPCLAIAQLKGAMPSNLYELKPETEMKAKLKNPSAQTENFDENAKPSAKIIREELSKDSYKEKLVNEQGLVIAAKTIKDNEVTQKELMFYYPNKVLQRKVLLLSGGTEFYAEDYYPNGKISTQSNYINEKNKIGREKKYDSNGTLRQEISWEIVKEDKKKPINERRTIRNGNVLSYYPDGHLAATFAVGKRGSNKYYDKNGNVIKEINNAVLLNFSGEIAPEDCQKSIVRLSLEDLVALYEDEGDISYNKCGLPYRENFYNEVMDIQGNSTTRLSFDDSGMLRKITSYVGGKKDGLEQKFDGNGNLTAEVNYISGIKSGTTTGYFPTKETAFRKRYENGKVVGKLMCYFPNGKTAAIFKYKNGKKDGIAEIFGAQARTITYKDGKITDNNETPIKRMIAPSKLARVKEPAEQCLNIDNKLTELEKTIKAQVKSVLERFEVDIPYVCRDMSKFKPEVNEYVCYDSTNTLRAIYPSIYNRGKFAAESIYSKTGNLVYEIQYNNQMRQGFTRQYDEKRNVTAEIYFDKGELAGTSRSYYPNGTTETMMMIDENRPHKFMVKYAANGRPEFSINYDQANQSDAFMSADNTDTYIKFEDNKVESIRENESNNITNFTEYNLLLGEYIKYQNNEIVGGGKICGYDKLPADVEVMKPQEPKAEVKAVAPMGNEPKAEVKAVAPKSDEPKAEVKAVAPKAEEPKAEVKAVAPKAEEPKVEVKAVTPKVEKSQSVPTSPETTPEKIKTIPNKEYEEIAPIMDAEEAPMVEGLEEISAPDFNLKNAIIPTKAEKKQAELASKNIGPVAKPGIEELTDTVTKVKIDTARPENEENETLSHTEKFYYPNGKLRKTITTRGNRTEEIKEYSKTGLMITDKRYQDDKKVVEKYYGSGEIRRKTIKGYDDNAVNAFISREDFYNNGNIRYEIIRQPQKMLFTDKEYDKDGKLKRETIQTSALSFVTQEYQGDKIVRRIEQEGTTTVITEFTPSGEFKKVSLNGKEIKGEKPQKVLLDNRKHYDAKKKLTSENKIEHNKESILAYYPNGHLQSEIDCFHNGEISVKIYGVDGTMEKFAYLSQDGKLHIQKPEIRSIPSYRERYWIDYNNPYWIENCDKYSVKNIARLNLDIISYIFAELESEVPERIKQYYKAY